MIINKLKNQFLNKNKKFNDICNLNLGEKPTDIYIIGNGPSLNSFNPTQFKNKFTIGTNRSWLWSDTNILIWRDNRITEEIDFFQIDKNKNTIWICSEDKSFIKNKFNNYNYVNELVDFTFKDKWLKEKLKTNIKWNGIVFHAIALAKHISKNATIHLIGIDLALQENNHHHFFNNFPGFNRGFYNLQWDKKHFNYQKRLDMMYENFRLLKSNGYDFKNYSNNSRLKKLFGLNNE